MLTGNRLTAIFVLLSLTLSSFALRAEAPVLKAKYPANYIVQEGDSLWDVAGKFLKNPIAWREFWAEPLTPGQPLHLFPGDEVKVITLDGKPRLEYVDGLPVRLSPRVRSVKKEVAIPLIPMTSLKPYLSASQVLPEKTLAEAPEIVGFPDKHVFVGDTGQIFVKGLKAKRGDKFALFRPGKIYVKPGSDPEVFLGQEALALGEAVVVEPGKLTQLRVTKANREILLGDKLLPPELGIVKTNFIPHAPKPNLTSKILSELNQAENIIQYQVVAIEGGKAAGIDTGTVFGIYNKGSSFTLKNDEGDEEDFQTSKNKIGEVMVFRTFDAVSYALVLDATEPAHAQDELGMP